MALIDTYLEQQERKRRLDEIRKEKAETTMPQWDSIAENNAGMKGFAPDNRQLSPQELEDISIRQSILRDVNRNQTPTQEQPMTTPDIWRGNIYEPGTVSTPEEQAYNKRYSDRMIAGGIMKSEPIYRSVRDKAGNIIRYEQAGTREVPDTFKRAESLQGLDTAEANKAVKEAQLSQKEAELGLKEEIAASKWQPFGYGQMYNPFTNEIRKVPVPPKEKATGAGGTKSAEAKVGELNQIKTILDEKYMGLLPESQQNALSSPFIEGSGNVRKLDIQKNLTREQRKSYNYILTKSQEYAGTMTPSAAVDRAVADYWNMLKPGEHEKYYPGTSKPQPTGTMEGRTATNPKTGQRLVYRGGKWQPL